MADPFELFFRDYASAFDDFDAERIASFFHFPCFMTDRERVVPYDNRSALVQNMRAVCAHHRNEGYGEATVTDIQVRPTAENLVFADVRWTVVHIDGSPLWEWSLTYALADFGEGWKIVSTTAHEETFQN